MTKLIYFAATVVHRLAALRFEIIFRMKLQTVCGRKLKDLSK